MNSFMRLYKNAVKSISTHDKDQRKLHQENYFSRMIEAKKLWEVQKLKIGGKRS